MSARWIIAWLTTAVPMRFAQTYAMISLAPAKRTTLETDTRVSLRVTVQAIVSRTQSACPLYALAVQGMSRTTAPASVATCAQLPISETAVRTRYAARKPDPPSAFANTGMLVTVTFAILCAT